MADLKFEIIKKIGVLSETEKGWKKEINLVKWNDFAPKYDLRDWNEDHTRMGKGITLTEDELNKLKNSKQFLNTQKLNNIISGKKQLITNNIK